MLGIVLATLIGVQPVEAHTNHRPHNARQHQHHRSHRPNAVTHHRWVWVSGHWASRPHGKVWVWGHWVLRPAPQHAHNRQCRHRH